jgi:hypothetical protein
MCRGGGSRTVDIMKLLSTLAVIPLLFIAAPATAAPQHNLVVSLTPPANPQVNITGHYVVRVTNTGNRNATGATLTVALPATHTSPQVYVLGTLTNVDNRCTRTGTTLTCALGTVARFGGYTEVAFERGYPHQLGVEAAAPHVDAAAISGHDHQIAEQADPAHRCVDLRVRGDLRPAAEIEQHELVRMVATGSRATGGGGLRGGSMTMQRRGSPSSSRLPSHKSLTLRR